MSSPDAITVECGHHDDGDTADDISNNERSSAAVNDGETKLNSARRSTCLLVGLLFTAFMLDGILSTVVVPILPSYLHKLNSDADKTVTVSPSAAGDVTERSFALASDSFYEWVDGSSRPAASQWLLERYLWLRQNWTDSFDTNLTDHSTVGDDYEDVLSDHDETSTREIFEFQREDGQLGILLATKAIGQIISNPIVGLIVNRWSYQIPLLTGIVILFSSSTIYIIATNYVLLVTARGIHGVATSFINISGMSALARNFADGNYRSRSMGIALSGVAAGILIGYPFGGLSIHMSASSTPFIVTAVGSLLELAVLIWLFTPLSTGDLSPISENPVSSVTTYRLLFTDPYILIAAGALLLPELAMATIESTVPAWMLDTMNPKQWQLGTVFVPDSIGLFVGCILTSYISSKVGAWTVTLGALLLAGISIFTLPFATEVIHLTGPHFFFGLSLGMVDASVMPLLAHLVDVRHVAVYGSVYSISQLAISSGFAIGPAVGGQLVQLIGFKWLLRSVAALLVIYAPLCCLLKDQLATEENTSILPKTNSRSISAKAEASDTSAAISPDLSFNYQKLL